MSEVKRKGAKSAKQIPFNVMVQLNRGELQTANLVEWLAVDQRKLLEHLLRQHKRMDYLSPTLKTIDSLPKQTGNAVNEAIGTSLLELSRQEQDQAFLDVISHHTADLVRCWATYTIGKNMALTTEDVLDKIAFFAADKHFGVREISWLAVRSRIAADLGKSIRLLSSWTASADENIRRFACEGTRPRGVWCAHIDSLKQHPEQALVLLEPLKADVAKYVQDSVGNWLNDASKTRPDFVLQTCQRWDSSSKETQYIIRKALRTLGKQMQRLH